MKEFIDLPRGKVTQFPTKVRRSYPFSGHTCYDNGFGQRSCEHEHPEAELQLQDFYEWVEGWTAQEC